MACLEATAKDTTGALANFTDRATGRYYSEVMGRR
jgi:hypothetical protein